MPLSPDEIEKLLQLVGHTQESEINCDGCLNKIAEFAKNELTGKSVPDGLLAVQQHLAICDECREEYEALKRTLDDLKYE